MSVRRRFATVLVVVALGVVAGVAILDSVRGNGAESGTAPRPTRPDAIRGTDVPPPGALPGRLLFAEKNGCRLHALDLDSLEVGASGPAGSCRIWASPTGELAVIGRTGKTATARDLWLVRVADGVPALDQRLGVSASRPSWAPDGKVVAWCGDDGQTVVFSIVDGGRKRLPGCYPVIRADGSVVTRLDDEALLQDGNPTGGLGPTRPGRLVAVGGDPGGGVVLAFQAFAEGFASTGELEFWRGGTRESTLPIPAVYGPAAGFFRLHIDVSPNRREAAFLFPESLMRPFAEDLAALVDLGTGRLIDPVTAPTFAGLAWSPDGSWLALATGDEVLIYGTGRTDPAYVLPLATRGIAWVRS